MSLFRDLLIEKKRKPYYCEVEYLEGTGTQYIDTGLDYFADFEIGIKLRQSVSNKALGNGGFYCMQKHNSANPYWDFTTGQGSSQHYTSSIPITEHHVMKWKDNKIYSDGVLLTEFTKDSNTSNRMYLYSADDGNKYPDMIYFCKLWEPSSGLLVRDFIPVLDFSLRPCMYDKISGRLFYNQNTSGDDFSYGREIHYVDYLESSGIQYIDTGIAGSSTLKIEMEGQKSGASLGVYFGAGTGNSRIQAVYINGYNSARIGDISIAQLGSDSERFNIVCDALNKTVTYNGTSYAFAYASALTNLNIYIFTRNQGEGSYADKATAKCWSFKIWDNNTLIRDYLPAIDENGVGFMFDRATHTIYDNAGTGYFKYPAREVSYLETTGGSYLDTGFSPGANGGTFTFDVEVKCTSNSSGHGAIGSRSADSVRNWVIMNVSSSDSQYQQFGYGSTYANVTLDSSGKWMRVKTYIDNSNYVMEVTVDGLTDTNTTPTQTFTNTANVYLLNINNKGSVFSNFNFIGQMRRAKLYNNGTLVKDYKPAFKNGYFGLWDAVNDYLPAINGTGTITYGKIVESRWF